MEAARPVTREVILVVCDGDGSILGELAPFEVPSPWWQEVAPIHERFPSLAVLRLLTATPAPGHRVGGSVTYLAEALEPVDGAVLRRSNVPARLLGDHLLRAPWARPGGPSSDLSWCSSKVERAGPARQHLTWNLSAVWSLPVAGGEARGRRVWLKCVPHFFRHEAAVLGFFGGDGVPRLVASSGHRILLEEMDGEDGNEASFAQRCELIDSLVALQLRTVGHTDELLAAGVPDARLPVLLAQLRSFLERRSGDDALVGLVAATEERVAEIDRCGLGPVLVHGDAHPGNARIGLDEPIWFDWGDSVIGHPFLDDRLVVHEQPEVSARLLEHFLMAWSVAMPGCDVERAWRLVAPLALLRTALVYESFLDNIEPTERVYHEENLVAVLAEAAASR